MPTASTNPKVDAYIEKAKPFAQPILTHLRKAIHAGCPEVVETIKWSRPFFEYRGAILCTMSAFTKHCHLGFWGVEIGAVARKSGAAASLRQITSVESLPPAKQLSALIRQGAEFVDSGQYTSPIAARSKTVKTPKPALKSPPELNRALSKNKKAAATFKAFSPSCRREYIEWIVSAKRPETREQRIATAIAWMADGKQRNWKYQK